MQTTVGFGVPGAIQRGHIVPGVALVVQPKLLKLPIWSFWVARQSDARSSDDMVMMAHWSGPVSTIQNQSSV